MKLTYSRAWGIIWDEMERQGIPTDSAGLADWRRRYGSPHAHELNDLLLQLYNRHLTTKTVEEIGRAIIAAFKIGKEFDGRIG